MSGRVRYSRCEYVDGRGRCRTDGEFWYWPHRYPQKTRAGTFASTVYRCLCAKHVRLTAAQERKA